jgi:hypothetical protein
MRDALLLFGTTSLATKDTAVYSANSLNLNLPATQKTGRFPAVTIVFQTNASFAAVDGLVPFLQDSADGSSWKTILTGAEITAPVSGQQIVMGMPVEHRQYLRTGVTPKSTGTFTAVTLDSWIELGK